MKKGDILTLTKFHPLYLNNSDNGRYKNPALVIGRSYLCIATLTLTSSQYYIPEYASLPGVTIVAGSDKWGKIKPCMPVECFRLANSNEKREYYWNPPHKLSIRGSKILRKLFKKLKTNPNVR